MSGTRRRTGRRPGDSGTRDQILAAARAEFGGRGYDGATIRGIAAGAGVDPALVHHYFGTKRALFVAALELPSDPAIVIPAVVAGGPREEVGGRLIVMFATVWDGPGGRDRLTGLVRSAVSHEDARTMLREFVVREVLGSIVSALGSDDAPQRAALVGSQLIGFAMVRYILQLEPIAAASYDQLRAWYGPTLQRYLVDPLS